MNKPFSLIINETKESIINILNNSNLHPTVMEMIVKDIYLEINRLSTSIIEKDKQQYLQESVQELMNSSKLEESVIENQALLSEEN